MRLNCPLPTSKPFLSIDGAIPSSPSPVLSIPLIPMEDDLSRRDPSSMEDPLVQLLLIPAPVSPKDDQGSPPESVLLDPYGYISTGANDSTAEGFTRYNHLIQVTFWAAPPPQVSCFTVHCPAMPRRSVLSAFGDVPKVLNTEEDLVLFRVAIFPDDRGGSGGSELDPSSYDYFVYQAGDMKERPSLHPILMPPFLEFSDREPVLLRRDGRGMFFIAILCRRWSDPFQFDINLYNSKTREWSTKEMPPQEFDYSYTSKAITIGGELGSVGWVDLWRGILIYDVLLDNNCLRYIPLPSPVLPKWLKSNPLLTRDIIVVNGYIKFFDMHTFLANTGYTYIPDGWEAATWKLNISNKDSEWEEDDKIKISEVPLKDMICAQMLPSLNEGEDTEPSSMRLHAYYPALSLHNDGVVHIMNRLEPHDDMVWMVAVDMRNQTLRNVASFFSGRPMGYGFSFLESGISKHLGICSSRNKHLNK